MHVIRGKAQRASPLKSETRFPFSRFRSKRPPHTEENPLPHEQMENDHVSKRAYNFKDVYDASAVKSDYVLTGKGLRKAQEQVKVAQRNRKVVLYDIDGMERSWEVDSSVELMVEANGMFQLADEYPNFDVEGDSSLYRRFRFCPFFPCQVPRRTIVPECIVQEIDNLIPGWREQWNCSKYPRIFDEFLTKNKYKLQKIDRVICFELGWLGNESKHHIPYAEKAYIRHLAVRHIANSIERLQAQNSENKGKSEQLPILAQDLNYTQDFSRIVKALGFEIVDFHLAKGLEEVTENSFVISLEVPDLIMQACIHLTQGKGPAGMLAAQRTEDHEKDWEGKTLNEQSTKDFSPWITSKELEYRNQCTRRTLETDEGSQWLETREIYADYSERSANIVKKVPVELLLRK